MRTFLLSLLLVFVAATPLPALQADGHRWVTEDGVPIELRGVNLGSWLTVERWMLRFDKDQFEDQWELVQLLQERFGEPETRRLLDVFRTHWITERDWEAVKDFGFNVVRLPISYELLMDDARPMELREDAWVWIDHAVDAAERHGLYIILDLHTAPGRQSIFHHSGRADQNRLWTEPQHQRQVVWLWTQIAERYKDRPHIAAFDLLNEPYGDNQQDMRELLPGVMIPVAKAIRATGNQQIILLPGTRFRQIDFYPPDVTNLGNIGFTVHHYPGRYGEPRTVEALTQALGPANDWLQEQVARVDGPLLLGEFNTNFASLGGPALLRHEFDSYAQRGWATTVWTLKGVQRDTGPEDSEFFLLFNADPIERPDLRTASALEIEAYFRRVGQMRYTSTPGLRAALTAPQPPTWPPTVPAERSRPRR